jgi:Fe2+ transport system protein B
VVFKLSEEKRNVAERILEEYGKLIEKKRKSREDLMLTFALEINEKKGDLKAEIEVDMYGKMSYFKGDEKVARFVEEAKKAVEELTSELASKERNRGNRLEKEISSDNNP